MPDADKKKQADEMASLSWQNVTLTAKGPKSSELRILKGLSGTVRGGDISCVLGHSGAGKTTVFNVLTGNARYAKSIGGTFVLNGQAVDPSAFAYAPDGDPVDPFATARESLTMSAKLRLPRGTSDDTIKQKVDEILEVLHLDKIADKLMGKGLSAGERRRVSLGRELVISPQVIVLDEATSGKFEFRKHVEFAERTPSCVFPHNSGSTFCFL